MVRKASNPESYDDALALALKILTRAAQTKAKLKEKLERRQFEATIIERVLKKLEDAELINDQKYAQDYISYRSRTSPLGSRYLKFKLLQKGIPKDIATVTTAEITSEQELELARAAAAKRLSTLGRYPAEERKVKLARFLAARGFSSQAVYTLIKEMQ